MRPTARTLVLVLASLACACTSYRGIQPVSPLHGDTVSGLRPTLEWKASEVEGDVYDLVIFKAEEAEGGMVTPLYRRDGLTGTSHTVERDLDPGREYAWSLRTRGANGTSSWNAHQRLIFVGLGFHRSTRSVRFATPEP